MPQQNRRNTGSFTSDDPGMASGGAISAGVLPIDSRYVLVSTAGNIVGKLVEDTADVTYILPVGLHKLAFRSVTSATAVGFFIL